MRSTSTIDEFLLSETVPFLKARGFERRPEIAIILGSGLGGFENRLQDPVSVPYEEIPGFPPVTVPGHSGKLVQGTVAGRETLVFAGRFHRYEGHQIQVTTLPVTLSSALGVGALFVSNAAGGINMGFRVGDLMQVTGCISLVATSLTRRVTERKSDTTIDDVLNQAAVEASVELKKGNYIYVTGPSYETPAEIRAFRSLGADAVGMSTVPELVAAKRLGIQAVAVSLITNAASGMTEATLDHDEIKEVGQKRTDDFARLVENFIRLMPAAT